LNAQANDPLAVAFAQIAAGNSARASAAAADAAVAELPRDPRAHALKARAALLADEPDRARRAIDAALALDPACVPALIERAALDSCARLSQVAPGHLPFWLDRVRQAAAMGATEAARETLAQAQSTLSQALELGVLDVQFALSQGDFADAAALAQSLRRGAPDNQQLLVLEVEALLGAKRAEQAAAIAQEFIARYPQQRAALMAWQRALAAAKAPAAQNLDALQRIAALGESPADALVFAMALSEHGMLDAVDQVPGHVRARWPEYWPARWMQLLNPSPRVHSCVAAEAQFRATVDAELRALDPAALAELPPGDAQLALLSASRFNVHYLGGAMRDDQQTLGALLHAMGHRALPPERAFAAPATKRRPRVGVMSAFMRRHTVTRLFGGFIDALDPAEFDLAILVPGSSVDAVTESLAAKARWFEHGEHALADWAQILDALDLDLLIQLDIGMSSLTEALATRRHARVQAMLWGHPVTSGLSSIDWFLTADAMERADAQADYSEQLWRLAGLGSAFTAPTGTVTTPAELTQLAPDNVLCAIPQMAQKLRPGDDSLLVELAAAAPGLRFALTPHSQPAFGAQLKRRLDAALRARGLDPAQVLALCRSLSSEEFFGLAARADFALDPIDWSGGNTSFELFWFDTPIVTLPGASLRSRHTLAMLDRMNLPELIASDRQDYFQIALRLATDTEFRQRMRLRIAARKHLLYDNRAATASFAEFVRRASAGTLGVRV